MNQATRTIAAHSTAVAAANADAAATQPGLPRRPRLAGAIASAIVTGAVFASVVLGMTSTGQGGEQLVAQAAATART